MEHEWTIMISVISLLIFLSLYLFGYVSEKFVVYSGVLQCGRL